MRIHTHFWEVNLDGVTPGIVARPLPSIEEGVAIGIKSTFIYGQFIGKSFTGVFITAAIRDTQ
jgi:hypothetical protein